MARSRIRISSILAARCPSCHVGKVARTFFAFHRRCLICGLDFYPEPGFYLGAMSLSFLLTALLTVPPMVALKLMEVEMWVLLGFPFVEFLFLGTFLLFYSRVLWLHVEYSITHRLDDER